MIAAIEKKRKEEAAANRANQGWGISNWWYGTSGGNSNNAAQDEALNEDLVITEEQNPYRARSYLQLTNKSLRQT